LEVEVVAGRTLDIKRCAVDQYKSQQLAQPSCWTPGEPAIGRYRLYLNTCLLIAIENAEGFGLQ